MSENIKKLFDKLNTLKSDFKAKGLKLELETEIISTTEIELAKHLAKESGLELTLKTSGCSAVSDIFLANAMDIGNILSPMIESPYALEKFYNNVSNICNDNHKNLMFNLETITGLNNIDNILAYKNINNTSHPFQYSPAQIKGAVFLSVLPFQIPPSYPFLRQLRRQAFFG